VPRGDGLFFSLVWFSMNLVVYHLPGGSVVLRYENSLVVTLL
jgi:hypothetical protein